MEKYLENKTVLIVPVERAVTGLINDVSEATMLTGASKSIKLPLSRKSGRLIDPFNGDTEMREWFEKKTGYNLNPNDPEGGYFTGKLGTIILKKIGKSIESAYAKLNLNDAYEHLHYLIAKASPRVANTWTERYDRKEYEFVIKDLDAEFVEELNITQLETEVVQHLLKIKNNRKEIYNLFRVFGVKKNLPGSISAEASLEWYFNELWKETKNTRSLRSLHNIINMTKTNYNMLVFVEDAIEVGAIETKGGRFELPGGQVIGHSMEDVTSYLQDKKNQDVKLRIKAQIEKKDK